MATAAPLRISLRRSRRLLLAQWLAHGLAAAAVLAANVPWSLRGALFVAIAISLLYQPRPPRVVALILHADGRLEKVGADGTAVTLQLHPHTTLLPGLAILLYRQRGRLAALPLLADSLSAEDFRQLRLHLRWRAGSVAKNTL